MGEEKPCVPCMIGVPVAVADHICKLTDNKECAQLQTDLIERKITVDQYFEKVGEILKEKNVDEGFISTFNNARKVYESVKQKTTEQQPPG
jgi:hypothetical protein